MNIFYNLFVNRKKSIIEFNNLDQTKNLKAAKETLSGRVGVYSIICNVTGAIYIGSSIDIGNRLVRHLVDNKTNEHLQNAIKKYGLDYFTFVVVEFCDLKVLLQREQHYLDILFSLPTNLRYNFLPTAGSSLGYKHTEEALAKISEAMSGIPSQSSYVWTYWST
jgi:group I intron endonuclease